MHAIFVLALGLIVVTAAPSNLQKIIGGSVTTIDQYRFAASLLNLRLGAYRQTCGGVVLTRTSILSAAHCFRGSLTVQWRARVGATNGNSGGTVFNTQRFINHPNYNARTVDNDIAIQIVNGNLLSNPIVTQAQIAGTNYNVGDNQVVWAIGWGRTSVGGLHSEQLRHVQIWTVNQEVCRSRYTEVRRVVTDNMLCAGWLDVGGRDTCQGDSGGPVLHNNVVVGVCSWGEECAHPRYPGVNARVSRYAEWIRANAPL